MRMEKSRDCFNKYYKVLMSAIFAGISIAIGGTAYLAVDNKIIGSFLFSIGLFCVCTFDLNLFTGKVCYIFDNDLSFIIKLPIIWFGNFIGTLYAGIFLRQTRLAEIIVPKAEQLCNTKLNDNLFSIFMLAVFCNTMIYIAVESYKNNPHEVGKYLGIILSIMVFILCGFEHCVANMYYFVLANILSWKMLLYLFIMTLGNTMGGILAHKLKNKCK